MQFKAFKEEVVITQKRLVQYFLHLLLLRSVINTEEKQIMNIHEYQGKEILNSFGVRIQRGIVAHNAKEAVDAAKNLPS